ncbi:MAG: patatin-like phospholipase family protein [Pseudomonadota bacterium]
MYKTLLTALTAAAALAACSHTPPFAPDGGICKLKRVWIEQPLPGEEPLESVLEDPSGPMLFLSGGSQNGAFGAGFLHGWNESKVDAGGNPVGLPKFSVVTGISTGALQATGAFTGRTDITIDGYTINSEGDLLDTYIKGSSGDDDGIGAGDALTAVRKGALSDLIPLRGRLDRILSDAVLKEVARRGREEGARLLVGATDFDLGQAVAFDMTELAGRYSDAPSDEEKKTLKGCYIEALIASSVVPGAAKPVFIDNRKYIDGGVRFAVFDDRVGQVLRDAKQAGAEAVGGQDIPYAPETSVYIIFNSDGEPKAKCAKVDDANCNPIEGLDGARKDWDFLSLVLGTVGQLVDQVQRLSIERARQRGDDLLAETYFARINADAIGEGGTAFAIPDFAGSKTCEGWRAEDDRTEAPLEFHKRFMRCLIEYGRTRGKAENWDYDNSGEVKRAREAAEKAKRARQGGA